LLDVDIFLSVWIVYEQQHLKRTFEDKEADEDIGALEEIGLTTRRQSNGRGRDQLMEKVVTDTKSVQSAGKPITRPTQKVEPSLHALLFVFFFTASSNNGKKIG